MPGCWKMFRIYFRALQIFGWMLSAHLRIAFMLPEGITMITVGLGLLHGQIIPGAEHGWPLYGERLTFERGKPYILYLIMAAAPIFVYALSTMMTVCLVHHLVHTGRITTGVPSWGRSKASQWIWDFIALNHSAPVIFAAA